jgi:hypothetical protein
MKTRSQNTEINKPDRQIARAALHDLQVELRKLYGKQAPLVLVYGSYARGEESAGSDVDLLLLYPRPVQPGDEIKRISAVLAELNLRYKMLISVLPAKEADYHHASGAFWQNLRREGIPLEQV